MAVAAVVVGGGVEGLCNWIPDWLQKCINKSRRV